MNGAHWEFGRTQKALRLALALAGLAACQPGLAQVSLAAADAPQLQVATSNLPRLDRIEGFSATPRVDFTLMPQKEAPMGVAFGMRGYSAPATPMGAGLAPTAPPAVDVGLHWQHKAEGSWRIGVTAWRRMSQTTPEAHALGIDSEPSYGARVEVDLNGGKKQAAWADKGLIGVQLDNGGRLSLRRKHGGPMLYYRNSF